MATPADRVSLVMSANRALLDEISSAVRAVFVRSDDTDIHVRFVFDGPISDEDRESLSCVGTEMVADFPDHGVCEDGVQVDMPNPVPRQEGWILVFRRKE